MQQKTKIDWQHSVLKTWHKVYSFFPSWRKWRPNPGTNPVADPGFPRRVISPQAVGIYLFFYWKLHQKKKKLNRRAFLAPLIYPPFNPIFHPLNYEIAEFSSVFSVTGSKLQEKVLWWHHMYIPFVKKYKKLDHCRTQGLFQRINFTVGRKILCKKIPVCV